MFFFLVDYKKYVKIKLVVWSTINLSCFDDQVKVLHFPHELIMFICTEQWTIWLLYRGVFFIRPILGLLVTKRKHPLLSVSFLACPLCVQVGLLIIRYFIELAQLFLDDFISDAFRRVTIALQHFVLVRPSIPCISPFTWIPLAFDFCASDFIFARVPRLVRLLIKIKFTSNSCLPSRLNTAESRWSGWT